MSENTKTALAVGAGALLLWWLLRSGATTGGVKRPIGAILGSKLLPLEKPALVVDVSTVNGDPFVDYSGADAFHQAPAGTAAIAFAPSLYLPAASVWPSMIDGYTIQSTCKFLVGDYMRRNDMDSDYEAISVEKRSDELTGEILGWIGKIIGMIGPIGKIFGMAISAGGSMALEVAGDRAAEQAKSNQKLPFTALDPKDPMLSAINSVQPTGNISGNYLGDSGTQTFYEYFVSRGVYLNDISQYSGRQALFARHIAGWLWPWLSVEFCGDVTSTVTNEERARRRAPIYRCVDMMLASLYPIFPSLTPGKGAGQFASGFVDGQGNDTGWAEGAGVGAGRFYYVNPFFGPLLGATLPPGGDDSMWTDSQGVTYDFQGRPTGSRKASIVTKETARISDPNILNAAMGRTVLATDIINAQQDAAATAQDIAAGKSGAENFSPSTIKSPAIQSRILTVV